MGKISRNALDKAWAVWVIVALCAIGAVVAVSLQRSPVGHGVDTDVRKAHYERSEMYVFWKASNPENIERAKEEVLAAAREKEKELQKKGVKTKLSPTHVVDHESNTYLARIHVLY